MAQSETQHTAMKLRLIIASFFLTAMGQKRKADTKVVAAGLEGGTTIAAIRKVLKAADGAPCRAQRMRRQPHKLLEEVGATIVSLPTCTGNPDESFDWYVVRP